MKLKLALALVLVAGLFAVLWLAIGSGAGGERPASIEPAEPRTLDSTPLAPLSPSKHTPDAREQQRETVAVHDDEPTAAATLLSPWKGQLAGVVGRVVDAAGAPQPGLRVDLLQADWSLLVVDDLHELGHATSLLLGSSITDDEGRFRIDGARGASFHGLGVDLGGPRGTLRVVEAALVHGEETDLGDIVLAPFGVLTGKVLDDAGQPLGGARIRVAVLPEEVLGLRLQDLRPESVVVALQMMERPEGVIELPSWLGRYLDRLPVPTTRSEPDGTFRLEGVPLARVVGGVDLAGYVGAPVGPIDVKDGAADLGIVHLSRGRTLHGVVLDATGKPVPGYEIHAGAQLPIGPVALLQPCGETDAEGGFTASGVPAEGKAVAVARPPDGGVPAVAAAEGASELVIRVPTQVELDVRVVDVAGAPLSGARLQLVPVPSEEDRSSWDELVLLRSRGARAIERFREVETGLYRCNRVAVGTYELRGEVAGLAPALSLIEVAVGTGVQTLICHAGRSLAVSVVDDASGQPVRGARVMVLQSGFPVLTTSALRWTDANGEARVGPFELLSESLAKRSPMGVQPSILLVEHPAYPSHEVQVSDVDSQVVVRLEQGAAVKGRIHWGDADPERLYMISLERRGMDGPAELVFMPRFGLSQPNGEFHFADLAPGSYRLEILERFLDADLIGLTSEGLDPLQVHSDRIELSAGQTAEVDVDLTPNGLGPTARIIGNVKVGGVPCGGARVRIDGARDESLQTDGWGHFESGELPARRGARVRITVDLSSYEGGSAEQEVHDDRIDLEAGEVHELEVDIEPRVLNVLVLEAGTGTPLAEAIVVARPKGGRSPIATHGTTDGLGRARLMLFISGPHHVEAQAADHAGGAVEADPKPDRPDERFTLELRRSVPCAGRIELVSHEWKPDDWLFLQVSSETGASGNASLGDESLDFSIDGLEPGTYKARLWGSEIRGAETTFELGPAGDTGLVLRF